MPIITLTELRDKTRRFSDTENKLLRHPNASLDAELNDSLSRLRELVSRNGHSYYLSPPATGSLTPNNAYQAIHFQGTRVLSIILFEGVDSWQLDEFPDVERAFWKNQDPSRPTVFRIRGRFTTAAAFASIEMYPVPDKAYGYELHILVEHPGLINPDDEFDDPFAWAEWACADAAQKLCLKDNDKDRFALCAQRKAELEAEILRMAPKQQRVRVARRRNTRAHRLLDNRAGYRRFP